MHGIRFFLTAVRDPACIGAIAPSSSVLARTMTCDIRIAQGQTVLELGPGTGAITRALLEDLPDPSAYLGIEREPAFVRILNQRFPQLLVVEGCAARSLHHLRAAGLQRDRIRSIISGLPFTSLPRPMQHRVIVCLDRLMRPGVVFRTFQYVHAWPMPGAVRFRKLMRRRFGPCTATRFVLRNLPPAFVLTWRR